ncbi:hypothetical protein G5I_05418 [Acromyrmex echinatior]|uniref:Uncharacterized protein n=1 Tax=Acromyrmex echinatior TaxID=103372 RepID=F4WI96_ACREC|nr:hypothetical protein G5I_05418 [Acromyrmex echinatior]
MRPTGAGTAIRAADACGRASGFHIHQHTARRNRSATRGGASKGQRLATPLRRIPARVPGLVAEKGLEKPRELKGSDRDRAREGAVCDREKRYKGKESNGDSEGKKREREREGGTEGIKRGPILAEGDL